MPCHRLLLEEGRDDRLQAIELAARVDVLRHDLWPGAPGGCERERRLGAADVRRE
jgi:hypothetical protein